MRSASFLVVLALPLLGLGCSQGADDGAATSDSALEVRAPGLWAGLPSYALERSLSDPCNNGQRRLDDQPIAYDGSVRERATVRNVCFEVWKPGATDTDNPNFWRELDVQIHYRYKGAEGWQQAYVPSIDRRGNNRRYAWNLSRLDPVTGDQYGDVTKPFETLSETPKSATIQSELEFYFTVNGNKLSTSTDGSFRVDYTATLLKKTFDPLPHNATKGVIQADYECAGATLGDGPGFYAVDITNQAWIDEIIGTTRYVNQASFYLTGSGASRVLTVPFDRTDNGTFPTFTQFKGDTSNDWTAMTSSQGSTLTVNLKVLERSSNTQTYLRPTFPGCVKKP
jgi:hypothetical protein